MTADVDAGRAAFDRRAWRIAYDELVAIDALPAADLERLAVAAHLVGRDDDSTSAWERAHHAWLDAADDERAARCAFWLGFSLLLRGEVARASGWLARAERLVERVGATCAVRGYLLIPSFLSALDAAQIDTAEAQAGEILEIAQRCGDRDLLALGLLCRGEARLAGNDAAGGLRSLDEAMVSVATGEVTPIPAGILYCAVIEACMYAFELRRAAEWTGALHAWCSAEPELVPYRGQCLVHRSQVLQAHGDWDAAMHEVELAATRLADPPHPALGTAHYQRAELHRLQGRFSDAEAAYRTASRLGRDPSPGLAQLQLARGDVAAARTSIRRMLAEGADPRARPAILAAAVEVEVEAGDVAAAEAAATELGAIADASGVTALRATADIAAGTVAVAADRPAAALVPLRRAVDAWQALAVPYETARARAAVADARTALGDHDGAELERAAARSTFERLGATADLVRLDGATRRADASTGALSDRELEVLRLVAGGRSNRQIGAELLISTHTVARHLQNIFTKLHLSSRTAAAAWAYEHHVVG